MRISAEGTGIRIAGAGTGFWDGPAEAARFTNPTGVAISSSGELRIADAGNYLVRGAAFQRLSRGSRGQGATAFAAEPPVGAVTVPEIPRLSAATLKA